ncbi:MAG: sigma 54-interacting transcriptional regulator [Candidatus Brocadiia bacterium]
MARLTSTAGTGVARFHPLSEKTSIGRDPANTIVLPDESVSRYHAEIHRQGSSFWVIDLGSSNGTLYNGKRVDRAELHSGDYVAFGGYRFLFEDVDTQDPPGVLPKTVFKSYTRELLAEDIKKERSRTLERFDEFLSACDLCSHPKSRNDFSAAICTSIGILVGADYATVLLRDGDGEGWLAFDSGSGEFVCATKSSVPKSVVEAACAKGEGVLIRDPNSDARFRNRASILRHEIVTVIATPFGSTGQAEGVLYAHRMEPALSFSESDLKLLFALSLPVKSAFASIEQGEIKAFEERRRNSGGGEYEIVGNHPSIEQVRKMISKLAVFDTSVLISGETGSGKELVARGLHNLSHRASHIFEAVNCAAISESLVESELFGHEKGAFTGAEDSRPGAFEVADEGTLFLDEAAELTPKIQAKLLRVLENGEIKRVGGNKIRRVNVRVISATNKNLKDLVDAGTFRADLFFRLNVTNIPVPPLRERRDDIPVLANHFLSSLSARMGRKRMRWSQSALSALEAYDWPGNVRELRNLVERALILSESEEIGAHDLPISPNKGSVPVAEETALPGPPEAVTLEDVERAHILAVLQRADGNKSLAAQLLGIDRSTLYSKLKQYGIG